MEDFPVNVEDFRQAVRDAEQYIPYYVKIKMTWQCNLRCKICVIWKEAGESRLTLPVLQKLADELSGLGTRKVHLSGGEALTRLDIFEAIDAFARHDMRVNLTTNGTLLDEKMAARLLESGLRNISVSLDGVSPRIHDEQRGKGNWKRTMRGIRTLRRTAKNAKRKLHIRVNTVITRRNYKDVSALPETVFEAGADKLTLIPVNDNSGQFLLSKDRILEYNEDIAPRILENAMAFGMISDAEEVFPFGQKKIDIRYSKKGLYALGLYEKQPCYMPWLHALIDPEGNVFPCCMMRFNPPLGNVMNEGGFKAVWEGEKFRSVRCQMLNPGMLPDACQACDDFLRENRALHRVVRDLS
jgi:radical SAM protein with 4Fe4S-binding SPASM domain